MQFAHFFPHQPSSGGYALEAEAAPEGPAPGSASPVPPPELRAGYGRTTEEYLQSGREDVVRMQEICAASGAALEKAGRILEMGCAGGRMIRWLRPLADSCEIWGTDIWASAIVWCQQHLSPPFHFATTTVSPHLPFEDRYFGCIYAGSVFTHIDDLVDAWFLELRRILRPGGRLYFSINDRAAVSIFEGGDRSPEEAERFYARVGGKDRWDKFVAGLSSVPAYHAFRRGEVDMVTFDRSVESHVLWDADFLCKRLRPFFRTLSVTAKAYGHQTCVLVERI